MPGNVSAPPPPLRPTPTLCPPPRLRPVVEGDSSGGLLLAEEGWGLHLGVAEAQVLVEIIKAIDKVTYMTAKHLKVEDDRSCFVFKGTLHRFLEKKRPVYSSWGKLLSL